MEEAIKRALISNLASKGFPEALLASESSLDLIRPLRISKKRFDLLYFYDFLGELRPLLLIECKRKPQALLQAKMQVASYNLFLHAPFLVVAAPNTEEITSPQKKIRDWLGTMPEAVVSNHFLGWRWWNKIPNYSDLVEILISYQKQVP